MLFAPDVSRRRPSPENVACVLAPSWKRALRFVLVLAFQSSASPFSAVTIVCRRVRTRCRPRAFRSRAFRPARPSRNGRRGHPQSPRQDLSSVGAVACAARLHLRHAARVALALRGAGPRVDSTSGSPGSSVSALPRAGGWTPAPTGVRLSLEGCRLRRLDLLGGCTADLAFVAAVAAWRGEHRLMLRALLRWAPAVSACSAACRRRAASLCVCLSLVCSAPWRRPLARPRVAFVLRLRRSAAMVARAVALPCRTQRSSPSRSLARVRSLVRRLPGQEACARRLDLPLSAALRGCLPARVALAVSA